MHHSRSLAVAVIAAVLSPAAGAQEFAAVVSPPRFEIAAKPGERVREVVEITNVSSLPSTFHLHTSDWTLAPDGAVAFSDDLAPDSCRRWVAIERREIAVPGGGRYRYRFEFQPPADAGPGECRFALMIEGDEQSVRSEGGLEMPVSGRIAIIVYAQIGQTAADLRVVSANVRDVDGRPLPVLLVNNSGNAHGRLTGFLSGTDANGRKLEFDAATLPILPGETRGIALTASDGMKDVTDFAYPVRIKGVLEWGDGQRIELDQLFAR